MTHLETGSEAFVRLRADEASERKHFRAETFLRALVQLGALKKRNDGVVAATVRVVVVRRARTGARGGRALPLRRAVDNVADPREAPKDVLPLRRRRGGVRARTLRRRVNGVERRNRQRSGALTRSARRWPDRVRRRGRLRQRASERERRSCRGGDRRRRRRRRRDALAMRPTCVRRRTQLDTVCTEFEKERIMSKEKNGFE